MTVLPSALCPLYALCRPEVSVTLGVFDCGRVGHGGETT